MILHISKLTLGLIFSLCLTQAMASTVIEVDQTTTQISSPEATQVMEAPAQVIEASPADLPLSSKLRQKRQQIEIETEEEMTQELEKARIADEKRRKERIFGDRIAPLQPSVQKVVQETPAPVVTPAPAAPITNTNTIVMQAPTVDEPSDQYSAYLGIAGGLLNYPMVENVNTANPTGLVSLGFNLVGDLWLSVGGLYSFQQTEIDRLVSSSTDDIDQFGVTSVLSYNWSLPAITWLTPITGLALSYTGRSYNGGDNSSSAIDGGFVGGVDLAINKGFSFGFEYRYMMNIDYQREVGASRSDVALQQLATGREVKNLESFDYQLLLMTTKINF